MRLVGRAESAISNYLEDGEWSPRTPQGAEKLVADVNIALQQNYGKRSSAYSGFELSGFDSVQIATKQ